MSPLEMQARIKVLEAELSALHRDIEETTEVVSKNMKAVTEGVAHLKACLDKAVAERDEARAKACIHCRAQGGRC